MRRIIGIIISLITLLLVTVIFCSCGNPDNENITLPEPNYYTVIFEVNPIIGGGYIEGKTSQKIKEGGNTEKITAVAEYGYYFACWMGLDDYSTDETVTRIDKVINNVTENLHIVVLFDKITVNISYTSDKNGYIDGESEQSVKYGEASESVTAMPNVGYRFKEWSDGVKTATRNEHELKENKTLTASFEPITNIYTYEYKFADGNRDDKDVALTYGQLDRVKLAVPTRAHAQFVGWYADKLLKKQVSDGDGNIITDDGLFYTDCDTLYAKWNSENTHQYKILIVYVTELNADIMKSDGSCRVKVQYKMSETERKICHMLTERFAFELNDLAVADFVVDEYFTTEPLSDEQVFEMPYVGGGLDNEIWPFDISEIQDMLGVYDSVLSSFSMNDYTGILHKDGGSADAKYAHVHFDGEFTQLFYDKYSMEDLLDPYFYYWNSMITTYWHELAHTIELRVTGMFEFHKVVSAYLWDTVKDRNIVEKLYFLNRAIVEGVTVGIPYEFWQGKVAKVYYEAGNGGYIYSKPHHNLIVGNSANNDIQYVIYNYDALSVTAYAFSGYEFINWSDGVTTATRRDKNITNDFHVYAIFKKIDDT